MIEKIDMDNGSYPYAKDIGRTLAKTRLNSSHRGIIDAILDKTYGWHDSYSKKTNKLKQRKTSEKISFEFFEEFTGMPFSKLSTITRELIKWRILKRKKQGRDHIYSFNVLIKEWDRNIFKKKFQNKGWGKVYHVVNHNSLLGSKVSQKLKLEQEYKEEGLLGSKPSDSLPDSKPPVYQVVNPEFTNQVTKKGEDDNKKEAFQGPKETLKETLKESKPKPCEAENLASPSSLPEYPARQGEKEKSLVLEQTTTQGKKSDSEMSQIRQVFAYWQQTFNHPKALLSKDRVGKIRSRLREDYTIPQLKRAIDGCKASSYHMGDNKYGKVYDSIGLIFRSAEKVEDFWGYLKKQKAESPTAKMLRELKEKEKQKND